MCNWIKIERNTYSGFEVGTRSLRQQAAFLPSPCNPGAEIPNEGGHYWEITTQGQKFVKILVDQLHLAVLFAASRHCLSTSKEPLVFQFRSTDYWKFKTYSCPQLKQFVHYDFLDLNGPTETQKMYCSRNHFCLFFSI